MAIARAFATRPRAMLLDEVTSALDPELVGEVLAAVRDLKAEGVTMLIATHEMAFAREVADPVGFLHEGRLLEVGPPEQVLEDPEQAETKRFLRRLLAAGRALAVPPGGDPAERAYGPVVGPCPAEAADDLLAGRATQ